MPKKNKKIFSNEEVEHLSYCYALYKTRNISQSRQIAKETVGLFILNNIEGEIKGIRGWIFTTTQNKCYEYFRDNKKTNKIADRYEQKLMFESHLDIAERDENLHNAYKKACLNLNENQLQTMILYRQCNRDYQLMHMISGVSVCALYKRTDRIRKKLRAETNLNMGVICTIKIVTPDLDNVVYKFLTGFKKHIEGNTLHKMNRYFSKQVLQSYQETFDIKAIDNYEIELDKDEYKVYVTYDNYNDETEVFEIGFKIKNRRLKITKPPKKKEDAVVLPKNSPYAKALFKLMNLYPPDPSGKSTIPKDLLDNLVAKYNNSKNMPAQNKL